MYAVCTYVFIANVLFAYHTFDLVCLYTYIIIVVQDPVDTTVCQDDDATFTCVLFISSGNAADPVWFRNGGNFDPMCHTVVSNLTTGTAIMAPAYVSSTITINNVATLDDGALYQCGLLTAFSNNGTLNVVGK